MLGPIFSDSTPYWQKKNYPSVQVMNSARLWTLSSRFFLSSLQEELPISARTGNPRMNFFVLAMKRESSSEILNYCLWVFQTKVAGEQSG